jgi:HAD superfamily hydrolase (TIGR01490 family)
MGKQPAQLACLTTLNQARLGRSFNCLGKLRVALAIFDLDETLIAGDSDHAWGEFMIERGLVAADHRAQNDAFYAQYKRGELDADDYFRFACAALAPHDMILLEAARKDFVEQMIMPLMLDKAAQLIEKHRQAGDKLLVITATLEFVTAPIVARLGINDLIAPIAERINDRYTGELAGVPSFGVGKVTRLMAWLEDSPFSLQGSHFYSDSANDLPLLELVDHPVAVDPDPRLRDIAERRQWPIISLRD